MNNNTLINQFTNEIIKVVKNYFRSLNIQSNCLEEKFNPSRGIRLCLHAPEVSRPPRNALRYLGIRLCSDVTNVNITGSLHRVDSVIESSLQEITGRKKFALINLN